MNIFVEAEKPTVLMGDAAILRGSLKALPVENGAKHFHVTNWNTVDDAFTWYVEAANNGDYLVLLR